MSPDLADEMPPMLGRVVVAISVEHHVFRGERTPTAAWVAFEAAGLRFEGHAGWGLSVSRRPLVPIDMGEWGHTEVTDMTMPEMIGPITGVWSLRAPWADAPIGIAWRAAQKRTVHLYDYDDELFVGFDPPHAELQPMRYDNMGPSLRDV